MTQKDYEHVCEQILNAVMRAVDISNMKHFTLDRTQVKSPYGIVYDSAAASKYPMALIYTPPGTGKSNLIKDRIKLLRNIGIPDSKMLILNMNIARTNQMKIEFPDMHIKTFSEFMHDIIFANYGFELSDTQSIANMLKLCTTDDTAKEFIKKLTVDDPQESMVLLTLFINHNAQAVLNILQNINRSDYSLDAMLCQNMMYKLAKNPYDVDAIMINGVQNMPVTALAATLEYADRFKCNLFITGNPDEAIYDFNMAYGNAMNLLSSYKNEGIDMIHLNNVPCMDKSIKCIADMSPNGKIDKNIVMAANATTNYDVPLTEVLAAALGPNAPYMANKLRNKEPLLILGRSRNDIKAIKQTIHTLYGQTYPDLKITDLTEIQHHNPSYGAFATDYKNELSKQYPNGISMRQLFAEIYKILQYTIQHMEKWSYKKSGYKHDLNDIVDFYNAHLPEFGDPEAIIPTNDCIKKLIYIEADAIQKRINESQNMSMDELTNADIILSTIHSATDIHVDNAIVVLKQNTDQIDKKLCHVALSRAMKSEYIVFINYGDFRTPYQNYIDSHIIK